VVLTDAAGGLAALLLANDAAHGSEIVVQADRDAFGSPPEPFLPAAAGVSVCRLLDPLLVKEWGHCFEVTADDGVRRVERPIVLLSMEQLRIELEALAPRVRLRLKGRRYPPQAPLNTPQTPAPLGWVHTGLWQLNQPLELHAPVIANRTLSSRSIFQFFPLAANLLLVREVSPLAEPCRAGGSGEAAPARLLRRTVRRLSPPVEGVTDSAAQGDATYASHRMLCDFVPAALGCLAVLSPRPSQPAASKNS
jgi:hypothetical protein